MAEADGPHSTRNAAEIQQAELAAPEESAVRDDLDWYGAGPGEVSFVKLL